MSQNEPDQQPPVEEQQQQPAPGADVGQAEVQERVDAEHAQGFSGVEVDPTPNENYAVQGVINGAPTPETDPEHAVMVQQHVAALSRGENPAAPSAETAPEAQEAQS